MSSRYTGLLRFLLLCAFAFTAVGARANIDAMSNNMFASVLTNYTPSGVYQTQSQGIIAGPSYYARIKNSNVQLMNLSLPRLKADCNGIDAWGGSFSFISADQLVNFLRTIASQAVPYAFKLALDAICPSCEKHMQKLQEIANFVNSMTYNSCDTTKKLFTMINKETGVGDAITEAVKPVATSIGTALGSFTDFFAGQRNNNTTPEAALVNSFPAQAREIKGNIAWKILTNSSLTTWWGTVFAAADDVSLREIMMSYTGTIIKDLGAGQAVGEPAQPDATLVARPIDPTITSMEQFLNGGTISVLRCDGDKSADGCLYPTPQNVTIAGFRSIVRQMIDGIIPRIGETGASTLTNAERSFLENAPGSVGTQLVRLSINPSAAYTYAGLVADYVGAELAAQFVEEVLQAVSIAATGERRDEALGPYLAKLQQRRDEHYAAFAKQASRLVAFEKSLAVADKIRERLTAANGTNLATTTIVR